MQTVNKQTTLPTSNRQSDFTSPLHTVQQFVREHLVGTIAATIAGSLLLTGASTWNLWNIYQSSSSTIAKQFELEKLSGKIVHLDEVLTMSARMAASTGDLSWEKRYEEFVPQLEKAIQQTLAQASEDIRSDAQKTDEANTKLVALETKAFELVHKGQAKEALQLLLGNEYMSLKKTYAQENQKVLDQINQMIQTQLQSYQQELLTSISFAVIILPILISAWGVVLLAVRDYIRDRLTSQMSLYQSQADLLTLNEELKVEAESRNQQEQSIRKESEQLQEDIGHLLDVVNSIQDGDFTIQAQVNERVTGLVGDTLNQLVEDLGGILVQVSTASERVSQNSTQQKDIAITVAGQTSEQAQSIGKVLALTETVRRSANNAATQLDQTNQSLISLQNAVGDGQVAVGSLNQEIDVLQQGSDRIIQQMKTLGEFVGLADQFVIDQSEIATQTQVLALNASLVAARAAEQRDPGQFTLVAREFASIASQVSQLAQQTNEGLANLEQRSTQIHRVVSDVDAEVQRLGGLVNGFTQGVKQTREVFQAVQFVTGQAVESGNTVAKTSQTIVGVSEATTNSMEAIAALSRKIAKQTQDARQISEQMNHVSADLISNIQIFKLPNLEEIAALKSQPKPLLEEVFAPHPTRS